MNYDIIIIGGAPGSGKSTVQDIVAKRLGNPRIDFGRLREFHLDRYWKKANNKEELMAFQNLVFIIKNYLKNKYANIMIDDLKYDKVIKLMKIFSKRKVILIILTTSEEEIKKRVGNPRESSGFKDVKKALEYNKQWKEGHIKNSIKIDNSHNNPKKTARKILSIIK